MKNQGYKIDYITNTVITTKAFMKSAGIIGTEAFQIRKTLAEMGMKFVRKDTARRGHKGITYSQMVSYIDCVENRELYMRQFVAMRAEAKSKNGSYLRVRAWFLETFPNFYDLPEFNVDNKVIVTDIGCLCDEDTQNAINHAA